MGESSDPKFISGVLTQRGLSSPGQSIVWVTIVSALGQQDGPKNHCLRGHARDGHSFPGCSVNRPSAAGSLFPESRVAADLRQ